MGINMLHHPKRHIIYKLFCTKYKHMWKTIKKTAWLLKDISWLGGQQHCIPRFFYGTVSIYNVYTGNIPKTTL